MLKAPNFSNFSLKLLGFLVLSILNMEKEKQKGKLSTGYKRWNGKNINKRCFEDILYITYGYFNDLVFLCLN